ncbi:unnamed protein product [Penicillium palitans]
MSSDTGSSTKVETSRSSLTDLEDVKTHGIAISVDTGCTETQTPGDKDAPRYPGPWHFAVMMLCAGSAAFLVGYDSNCVATIIPVLVKDFQTTGDMVWYSSAYLMTSAASVLSLGKIYNLYPFKIIFTITLAIFLIGSIICTVAQNSVTFIVGRAITGLASAGILSVSRVCSLERRSFWQGVVGMAECVAICAGPLIGGVLAEYGGWRSCFYVTIPIAVLSLVLVLVLFQDIEKPAGANLPLPAKLSQCDPIGVALLIPTIFCLILALEWAGTFYDWTNFRVLLPLCLSIPLWFQTARENSTLASGISTLPMVISLSLSLILSGSLTSYIGYYTPSLIFGSCLLCVGTGLLTTLTLETSTVKWAIYQAVYGVGCGLGWQAPYIAIQAVLPAESITIGIVLVVFSFTIGGIMSMAVGQNIYLTRLVQLLRPIDPSITTEQLNIQGLSGLIQVLGPASKRRLLQAYNDTVVDVLYSAVAVSCAALLCALFIEVKSVKKKEGACVDNPAAESG